MKKKNVIMLGLVLSASLVAGCGTTNTGQATDAGKTTNSSAEELKVANDLFVMTMPKETAGTYEAEAKKNSTSIYDKESKEANCGGFVFDATAYAKPGDYDGELDTKVGEFTDADGTLYDIVLTYPSDVQYDFSKGDGAPENYARLYDSAEDVIKTMEGVKDGGKFTWNAGMKGKDLYGDLIKKYDKAIEEGWDANHLEEEDMSPELYAMSLDGKGKVADRVGFTYYDINKDGIDELFISQMPENGQIGFILDIYTMVDRKQAHLVTGTQRSRYYLTDSDVIVNEYSAGAGESGWDGYYVHHNDTELMDQWKFKIDEYENEKKPWFISYDNGETWESLTEKEFNEKCYSQKDYVDLKPTPFSGKNASVGNTPAEESEADYLGIVTDHKQKTSQKGCDTFTQMVDKTLKDGQGYVNTDLSDTNVIIVSENTFGGYDDDAAMEGEIFCYADDGIKYLGFVQAGGTATPLAVKDGAIYTLGHHYAGKHTIKNGKLVTVEEAWSTSDADGNEIYHSNTGDGTKADSAKAKEVFDKLFTEYNDARILGFSTVKRS